MHSFQDTEREQFDYNALDPYYEMKKNINTGNNITPIKGEIYHEPPNLLHSFMASGIVT